MFDKFDKKHEQTDAGDVSQDADPSKASVMVEDREPLADAAGTAEAPETDGINWQNKYRELNDQFVRLAADFENYRKRTREEQQAAAKYGSQNTVMELLPVLDNLDRATASLTENSDPKTLYKSFGLVYQQLMNGLEGLGVKRIQAVGQPFDPQYHEAVSQMPSAEYAEGLVMAEAQSGYTLHDKVIRPAMVVVSIGNSDESPTVDSGAEPSASEEERGNPFKR